MKKLNMGRLGLTFCLVSAISISSAIPALADWEQQTDGNWKYKNDDGSYVTSSLIDGYYVNGNGIWLEDIKADNGSSDSWKNENVALEMGLELQNSNDWSINPVKIYTSISAGYGKTNDVMNLWKTDDGYEFNIYTKLTGNAKKGFQALCYLISDDDTLFNILYNASESDNSYGITTNSYTTINSYQIKATVTSGCVSFSIKTV